MRGNPAIPLVQRAGPAWPWEDVGPARNPTDGAAASSRGRGRGLRLAANVMSPLVLLRRRDEVALAAEGLVALVLARSTMHLVSYARLARVGAAAERAFGRAPRQGDPEPRALGLAVKRAARVLPWHSTCLARALAAQVLLRRRGVPSRIVFGVRRSPARQFEAHAWVEHNGAIVIGDDVSGYQPLQHAAPAT